MRDPGSLSAPAGTLSSRAVGTQGAHGSEPKPLP